MSASLQQPIVCQATTGVQGNCSFVAPSKPSYNFTSNVCQNVLLKVRDFPAINQRIKGSFALRGAGLVIGIAQGPYFSYMARLFPIVNYIVNSLTHNIIINITRFDLVKVQRCFLFSEVEDGMKSNHTFWI